MKRMREFFIFFTIVYTKAGTHIKYRLEVKINIIRERYEGKKVKTQRVDIAQHFSANEIKQKKNIKCV